MSDVASASESLRWIVHDMSPVWEYAGRQSGDDTVQGKLYARDRLLRQLLALVDIVAAYAALLLAIAVARPQFAVRPLVGALGPLIVLASKALGLYDRDQHTLRKTTLDEAPSILGVSLVYAFGVWLAESLLIEGSLARTQVFALALGCFVAMTAGRSLARRLVLAWRDPERCLVVGSAADTARMARKFANAVGVNSAVVGRVALRDEDRANTLDPTLLGGIGQLAGIVVAHEVERVIVAADSDDQDATLSAIRLVKALGVKLSVLPRLLEVVGSSSMFDDVDGITLLGVRQYGLARSSDWLKRLLDLCAASAGLVVLAPAFVLIALAIKLGSPGPVFFKQPRIGRRGQRFRLVKFRSMVADAERVKNHLRPLNEAHGGLFKIERDPRITRVGGYLRRSSLDELPQLLNVLAGDMSLVGPRPLVPDEDALIEGWQRRRLAVKPGMTGLWQIFGSSRIPLHEMVKIDYLYGANWSIWLDVKILLRTVPYVLRRRGR